MLIVTSRGYSAVVVRIKRGSYETSVCLAGGAAGVDRRLRGRSSNQKGRACRARKGERLLLRLSALLRFLAGGLPAELYGITFYATVDMGGGWESHGTPFNGNFPTGVEELIQKNSNQSPVAARLRTASASRRSASRSRSRSLTAGRSSAKSRPASIPIRCSSPTAPARWRRTTPTFAAIQNTNADSSRAGQWDNSVAYGGFSHATFGTLTAGRENSLTLDGVNAYDPMGGSYAFSPIGWSGKVAGAGSTEDARMNTAVKYQVQDRQLPRQRARRSSAATTRATARTANGQFGLGGDFFDGLSVDGDLQPHQGSGEPRHLQRHLPAPFRPTR